MDMNANYLIISPQSDTNCFYHCLAYQVAILKGEDAKALDQKWMVEYCQRFEEVVWKHKRFRRIRGPTSCCRFLCLQFHGLRQSVPCHFGNQIQGD
jgi:hypothetical protein